LRSPSFLLSLLITAQLGVGEIERQKMRKSLLAAVVLMPQLSITDRLRTLEASTHGWV
jgi:hypothetical protein